MNAAQIESKLTETREKIAALNADAFNLECDLRRQRDVEAELAKRAAWAAVREMHCAIGSFFVCATAWESSAGGRVLRCRVGAGLRRKDGTGTDLLAVYEITDYRGRTMALVHGQRPPEEIELEMLRGFDAKRS